MAVIPSLYGLHICTCTSDLSCCFCASCEHSNRATPQLSIALIYCSPQWHTKVNSTQSMYLIWSEHRFSPASKKDHGDSIVIKEYFTELGAPRCFSILRPSPTCSNSHQGSNQSLICWILLVSIARGINYECTGYRSITEWAGHNRWNYNMSRDAWKNGIYVQ